MRTSNLLPSRSAIAALLACVTISLLGCGGSNGEAAIGVSVDNVLGDPDAYYGSRLTVSGTVGEIVSPTVFTIQGTDTEGQLLIVSVDSIAPTEGRTMSEPVAQDDIVQVTGQVREFTQSDLEAEFGFSLTEGAADFNGQPVIVARNAAATLSSVVVTPRPGSVVTPPDEAELITNLSAITGPDADEMAGEAVHLQDVTVSATVDERSFWAASGGDSVFVVLFSGASAGQELQEATSLELFGILRELPSTAILGSEWGLSADLVRQLESESVYLHGIRALPGE